jgi:hypothetical protein
MMARYLQTKHWPKILVVPLTLIFILLTAGCTREEFRKKTIENPVFCLLVVAALVLIGLWMFLQAILEGIIEGREQSKAEKALKELGDKELFLVDLLGWGKILSERRTCYWSIDKAEAERKFNKWLKEWLDDCASHKEAITRRKNWLTAVTQELGSDHPLARCMERSLGSGFMLRGSLQDVISHLEKEWEAVPDWQKERSKSLSEALRNANTEALQRLEEDEEANRNNRH